MLIGRDRECARIDELLDRARLGRSSALVIRGEAGIGKTALLDYVAERAEGLAVVRAMGIESEADLEFSALLDICRPLLSHLAEIPEYHAEALRAALDLGPAVTVDRFAIGAGTLGVLAAAAEATPLLVLVDDAHWLDPSSADALLFATRRLQADRVLVLYALRDGEGRALDTTGIESIVLTGLSCEHGTSLLSTQVDLSPDVAHRLYEATGGNPLALLELPGLLSSKQLSGVAALDEPLPAGSGIERAFARRADTLADDSRRALLVAAVSMSDALEPLVAALESLGLGTAAFEPAEDAGLIALVGDRLEFRHPLVRSALYQAARPSERREAHSALAEAHADGGDPALRAWHLAAATLGRDEEVAAALEAVADRARERNAHAEAAAALEKAAHLTPDRAFRSRRFTTAAEAAWAVGNVPRALALIGEAEDGLRGPAAHARARVLRLRGLIERHVGTHSSALEMLLDAEALLRDESPSDAAEVLLTVVPTMYWAGNVPGAVASARRLRELAPRDGSQLDATAEIVLGWILFNSGAGPEGAPALERGLSLLPPSEDLARFRLMSAAVVALAWLEQPAQADELAVRALRIARSEGAPEAVLMALFQLTPANVRAGRWGLAVAEGLEGLILAQQLGRPEQHTGISIDLARVDAGRGKEESCRARVAECVRLADEHGMVTLRVAAECVLGLLALGLGRIDEAVEQLERAASEVERLEIHDRDVSPHPDLIEALIRGGRRNEAASVVDRYAERSRAGTPLWGGALVARSRGMLAADDEEADAHFSEALELHSELEDRFQQGRTFLAYGSRLRRSGQRRHARERLREALELFEELEARPWVERSHQELRASGEKLRRREAVEAEQLTPQELQIALQVAEGKTNKEVGAALFLSHKTVEFHLSRVYRKLDINSRAELIRRFASEATAVPS